MPPTLESRAFCVLHDFSRVFCIAKHITSAKFNKSCVGLTKKLTRWERWRVSMDPPAPPRCCACEGGIDMSAGHLKGVPRPSFHLQRRDILPTVQEKEPSDRAAAALHKDSTETRQNNKESVQTSERLFRQPSRTLQGQYRNKAKQ